LYSKLTRYRAKNPPPKRGKAQWEDLSRGSLGNSLGELIAAAMTATSMNLNRRRLQPAFGLVPPAFEYRVSARTPKA